jgi:peptidoglycan hydrolase CwlO-like protein
MKLTLQILALSTIILFSPSGFSLFSQETAETPSIGKGSIENQFNYVLYRSEKYEDYKMVKSWWLYTLRSQVLDTLKALHENIRDTQNLLSEKKAEIDSLITVMKTVNNKLDAALKEKGSLKLMGIKMDKILYNSIMWFIIAALIIFLLVFIILFKRSNAVTSKIKSELADTRKEYEEHRKRALVREQQIVRQLYDEILKYKNKLNL